MRKTAYSMAAIAALAIASLSQAGCGSDPAVRAAVVELRTGAIVIMDDRDAEAAAAGHKPLPKEYRDDKIGAYDDLLDLLDGKKPAAVGK